MHIRRSKSIRLFRSKTHRQILLVLCICFLTPHYLSSTFFGLSLCAYAFTEPKTIISLFSIRRSLYCESQDQIFAAFRAKESSHRCARTATTTHLCAKKRDKSDKEDGAKDSNSEKSIRKPFGAIITDRASRIGKGVVNSVFPQKDSQQEEGAISTDNVRKNWIQRMGSSITNARNKQTEKDSRLVKDEEDPSAKKKPKSRAVNPLSQFIPFDEVTLAKALQSQQNEKNGINTAKSTIPNLTEASDTTMEPIPSTSSTLKPLDDTIYSIEQSLFNVREQLTNIRLNLYDENNDVFLTPGKEERRLRGIRSDLEQRKRALERKRQQEKKEAEERANQEAIKQRMNMRAAQREIRERKEAKRKQKERERLKKLVQSTAKGEESIATKQSETEEETKQTEKSSRNLVKDASVAVEGAFIGAQNFAQSAFSNAWKTVKSRTNEEGEWITVCPKTRVSPGEVVPVVAGGIDLLVIASRDGQKLHCLANSCSHLGTPLETGLLERRPCPRGGNGGTPSDSSNSLSTTDSSDTYSSGDGMEDCIVCPLHQTAFALESGEVRGEWCPYPPLLGKAMGAMKAQSKLPTFKLRTRGKNIEIKITSSLDDLSKE